MNATAEPVEHKDPTLSRLKAFPEKVREILETHAASREETRKRVTLPLHASEEQKQDAAARLRENLEALAETTAGEMEALAPEIQAAAEKARETLERQLTRPEPKDTSEALLREMREQRYWNRVKPLLDASTAHGDVTSALEELTHEAARRGDEDAISALRAEADAYLSARFEKAGDKLADRVLNRPAKESPVLRALSAYRPEIAAAHQAKEDVERGTKNLLSSLRTAAHQVRVGEPESGVIGFPGQEPVRVRLVSEEEAGAFRRQRTGAAHF